jgi:opacity protein-like surface antigen
MKKFNVAALALTVLSAPAAFAQSAANGTYGELGLTQVSVSRSDGSIPTFKPTLLRAVVGYGLSDNFALEGILGAGMGDASVDLSTYTSAKVKVDSMFGAYLKVKAQAAPGVELFGRVGYAKIRANSSTATPALNSYSSSSEEIDGASWGVGAKIAVSPTVALTVDFMSYVNKNGATATGPTFGVAYKF